MNVLVAAVKEYQQSHLQVDPTEPVQPMSPEKTSPSAISDKTDYSSIHSRSIPVSRTLYRKPSFYSKSKMVKTKVLEYTYMSKRKKS